MMISGGFTASMLRVSKTDFFRFKKSAHSRQFCAPALSDDCGFAFDASVEHTRVARE